jgi:hypothetical protein
MAHDRAAGCHLPVHTIKAAPDTSTFPHARFTFCDENDKAHALGYTRGQRLILWIRTGFGCNIGEVS